jgi:hypothetical protein
MSCSFFSVFVIPGVEPVVNNLSKFRVLVLKEYFWVLCGPENSNMLSETGEANDTSKAIKNKTFYRWRYSRVLSGQWHHSAEMDKGRRIIRNQVT